MEMIPDGYGLSFGSIGKVYVIVFVVFHSQSACDKQKCRNFAENLIEFKNNKINRVSSSLFLKTSWKHPC